METTRVRRNPASAILLRPFQTFFGLESASGILLLLAAVIALIWANSPFAASYFSIWEIPVTVGVGEFALSKTLHHWINDGLMSIFFFVVGLEIKREILMGELASPKKAALSVVAAIGGMLVPAAIYALINMGTAGASGWGIPMATDIAFAVGVLALLGSRVPLALKVFVTAVAIVDDLGAVMVIALFYTAEIAWSALALAAIVFVALILVNRLGIRSVPAYALFGIVLWFAFLKSGIHATIAGVLLAMTIPASQVATEQSQTPLTRLEHTLHPWVAFFIMPVFALANAGVALGGEIGATLTSPVTLGVILGLFFGKQIGILAAAWISTRTGLAVLPSGVNLRQIWGVSMLCGIGFTMSLFIAGLAFADAALLDSAKVGILAASLLSGAIGGLVLVRSAREQAGFDRS